jgi:folate-binding protein YgfZ
MHMQEVIDQSGRQDRVADPRRGDEQDAHRRVLQAGPNAAKSRLVSAAVTGQFDAMSQIALLPNRAVLSVTGDDRVSYLQGLLSNDVTLAAPGRAIWSALLTPQGKWLADFFIFAEGDRLLLDVEAAQRDDLARRLTRFRLRAKVAVEPAPLGVYAAWDGAPDVAGLIAPDPRLPEAGWRVLGTGIATNADADAYDRHRLRLGLPDGSRDMETEKTVLLEAGFDELGGVSWTKGCYMGQELTARTKYRGLLKRRLVPVSAGQTLPAPGTPVTKDGVEVGTLRSSNGELGLALMRLDALDAEVECGMPLAVHTPTWMQRVLKP